MNIYRNMEVNEVALKLVMIEVKLHINQKLYQKGAITEEMYTKAKELILKDCGGVTYASKLVG
jgi:hypothetical protein